MSDQLYTSINLSSASLLQGAVAATGAGPLVLGVAPADGSLTSVTVNSDGNDSGITLTVQVDGERRGDRQPERHCHPWLD
jgi:hypothetical protein